MAHKEELVQIKAELPSERGTRTISLTPQILLCLDAGNGASTYRTGDPLPISRTTFPAVMKKLGPRIEADVDNALSGDADQPLHVDLVLDLPPDQWPRQIVEQVPALAELAATCEALLELQRLLKVKAGSKTRELLDKLLLDVDPTHATTLTRIRQLAS
jgi:type VI secretion system ImpB/VipA family protein